MCWKRIFLAWISLPIFELLWHLGCEKYLKYSNFSFFFKFEVCLFPKEISALDKKMTAFLAKRVFGEENKQTAPQKRMHETSPKDVTFFCSKSVS